MTVHDFVPSQRFLVVRRLGEGGMGVVYEAMDLERRSRIALKTLRSFSPEGLLRFKREFRALQDVRHQNLVNLGELFSDAGRWYFSMELVDGPDFLGFVSGREDAMTLDVGLAPTEVGPPAFLDVQADAPSQPVCVPSLNIGRLHSALRQLGNGLMALHGAGLVHRDVKPNNIRVTRKDRLVLLDFGLVSRAPDTFGSSSSVPMGTPEYMAPEQASRGTCDPSCDWYSVGVLLFEALTGQLPFEGRPFEILMRKHAESGPDPRTVSPGAPAILADLARDLMTLEPAARPSGAEAMQRIDEAAGRPLPSVSSEPPPLPEGMSLGPSIPFIGRASELAELNAAFELAATDGPLCVLLEGESGIGKTAILRCFRRTLLGADEPVLVFWGRCREREAVPYAGIDEVMDALSRFLVNLPAAEVALLLPARSDLLGQVFPVLRRVNAIAQAASERPELGAGLELRRLVFATLRELLGKLSQLRPIVLAIDDLQWADADTLALLEELVRPGERLRMLLIGTARTQPRSQSAPRPLEALGDRVRTIHVSGLSAEQSVDLATLLVSQIAPARAMEASNIARESSGHPFFLHELVRHAMSIGGPNRAMRLDDALSSRIGALDRHAGHVLQLVALAGGPTSHATIARAARMSTVEVEQRVGQLRSGGLVRTPSGRRADLLEPYHDRIREVVRAHLEPAARRSLHERLALALEAEGGDSAEDLARHWRGAGDLARAAAYATKAADDAAGAFAFDRAARLYRFALAAGESAASLILPTPRWVLWEKLAHCLAAVGKSTEAARAFQKAAVHAPQRAAEFRSSAADQLLRSGNIEAGLTEIAQVMRDMGVRFPSSTLAMVALMVLQRVLLRLRGLKFVPRRPEDVIDRDRIVVDILLSLTTTLSMVDPLRCAYAETTALWRSLRIGDPSRGARAIAWEILYLAMLPGKTVADLEQAYGRAVRLANEAGDGEAAVLARGVLAGSLYVFGHYQRCLEVAAEVDHAMQAIPGASAELQRVRIAAIGSLAQLGSFKELGTRAAAYQRECDENGDRYGAANLRIGLANMVWLADDRPAAARASVARALLEWPAREYTMVNYWALYALVQADLYEGDGDAAWSRLLSDWPAMRRAFILRPPPAFASAAFLRARAAIAAALDPVHRAERLKEVVKTARTLRGLTPIPALPMAALLDASVHHIHGDTAGAESTLEAASRLSTARGMAIHAAAADLLRGRLLGGARGASLEGEAERRMQECGVANAVRMAAVILPSVDLV